MLSTKEFASRKYFSLGQRSGFEKHEYLIDFINCSGLNLASSNMRKQILWSPPTHSAELAKSNCS